MKEVFLCKLKQIFVTRGQKMFWLTLAIIFINSYCFAQVSGTIFSDYNANGIKENTSTFNETGLSGVIVKAYGPNEMALAVTYTGGGAATNATGGYAVTGGTIGQIRLEFKLPNANTFATLGSSGGTTVMFPTLATQNLAVNYTNDYCQANPYTIVPCYENGQSAGNANPGVIQQIYSASGVPAVYGGMSPTNPQAVLSIQDVGAVWGAAYKKDKKLLYLSAVTKRHIGFGIQNEGGIYVTDMSGSGTLLGSYSLQGVTPANGGPTINLGTVTRTGGSDYTLSNSTTPSIDLDAFNKVGKTSYGDAEISEDGKTLWLTNLNQIGIISVDISGANPLVPGVVKQYLVNSPPTCNNGVFRIYGLKEYRGRLYVGGVCTGENGGTAADLRAYVISYNISNMAAGYTVELNFPLTYTRELQGGNGPLEWRPWVSAWQTAFNGQNQHWAQALIGNIEFTENGSMVLGFLDRFGNMGGYNNYPAIAGYTGSLTDNLNTSGDIIHVCKINGTWALEGASSCTVNDLGSNRSDGPSGQGEFYWNDNYIGNANRSGSLAHEETTTGALALLMGTGNVITTVYDPIDEGTWLTHTQGVHTYRTTNGNFVSGYLIVKYSPAAFGKANGLGDIELLCDAAPLEIGNRVWNDANNDGIQNAGESPLSGITVDLYEGSTKVGTTTTASDGSYYFNNANVNLGGVSGLKPDSTYQIRIATAQAPLSNLILTTTNVGSNGSDLIDNDATTSGSNAVIDVTLGSAGQNNHTLDFGFIQSPPTITTITSVSGCFDSNGNTSGGTNQATVQVNVDWANAPSGENIILKVQGQADVTINPATATKPFVQTYTLTADASSKTVDANYSVSTSYAATQKTVTLPAGNCLQTPCESGNTGGQVWRDYNNNGIKDTTETQGVSGLTVKAYDCNGVLLGTTTTDALGQYTFSGFTPSVSNPVRLEFSGVPTPYKVSGSGSGNGTDVQFVSAAGCNYDLGVNNPADYCQVNPLLFTPCYIAGDPIAVGSSFANFDAVVKVPYNHNSKDAVASFGQVGTTWGSAYDNKTDKLYLASALRRHTGLGTDGLGAIYVLTNATTGGGSVSSFTVPNVGTVGTNASRGLSGSNALSHDPTVFDLVGKTGLGDMDIDQENQILYVVNLNDKKVYQADLKTGTTMTALPTDYTAPTCTNGSFRPWGLKYADGKLYLGGVCSAEGEGGTFTNTNLKAHVMVYNTTTATWEASPTLSFNLDYPREEPYPGQRTGWYPWIDAVSDVTPWVDPSFFSFPTPILSDIEFDDSGNMILGFLDRTSFQFGARNYGTDINDMDNLYYLVSGGDILRATKSGNSYTIESIVSANDEFFGGEEFLAPGEEHKEASFGGLAVVKGKSQVVLTAVDPNNFDSGGFYWLSTNNGVKQDSFEIYVGANDGNPPTFAKTSGLGDVEPACAQAPLEVGNYVWQDSNLDGVQDPCEVPLSNVKVELWKNGTKIAETTTNSSGNYYFSSKSNLSNPTNWTGTGADTTLLPSMAYEVRIDTSNQAAFINLALTAANSTANNGNDQNDNDAITTGNYKVISFTTGAAGSVNHTYDFGFYPFCDTTLVVTNATTCSGTAVDLFTLASGVKGTLSYSTDGTTWTALTSPTNVTPSVTTTYYVKDTLVSGCFDIDTLVITVNPKPTTPSVSSPIMNICPLTTVDLTTISAALTPSVSGGVFEWHVSNSSASAMVSNPNDVVAGDYYLFERSPADCYSTGLKVTVAIQVCCPTLICVPMTVTRNN